MASVCPFEAIGFVQNGRFSSFSSPALVKTARSFSVSCPDSDSERCEVLIALKAPSVLRSLIVRNSGSPFITVRFCSAAEAIELSLVEKFQSGKFPLSSLRILVAESQQIAWPAYASATISGAQEDPKRCRIRTFKKWPPLIDQALKVDGASFLLFSLRNFPDCADLRQRATLQPTMGISWIEIFGEAWKPQQTAIKRPLDASEDHNAVKKSRDADDFAALLDSANPSVPLCRCSPQAPCVPRQRKPTGSEDFELTFLCASRTSPCSVALSEKAWNAWRIEKGK